MKRSLQSSKFKIGILGGGQLGWMLILEGRKFPFDFYVLEKDKEAPACRIADKYFSPEDYKQFVDECDIVTFEFEHVYDKALEYANEKGKLIPSIETIILKRERHREKLYYLKHGFPTPRFLIANDGEEALKIAKDEFNGVAVIKQSHGGYDGKNQYFLFGNVNDFYFLKDIKDIFIVEEYINFDYEASVIVVKNDYEVLTYPPTYNFNQKGILVYNYGPFKNEKISEIAANLAKSLDYTGVMGVEFMIKGENIYINEFAPRVHNTGHYTLDAAFVSQFENHIRAISNLELGSTELFCYGGMLNILGISDISLEVLKYGKLYWYGKKEVRKRRKMGHINVVGSTIQEVKHKIDELIKIVYPEGLDL